MTRQNLTLRLRGRSFAHPLFDYLLIGGGLSLVVTLIVAVHPLGPAFIRADMLPYLFLLSNAAHFAASTVRLYTKPGSYEALPFLTMGFPLLALAVLTLCLFFAGRIGPHLQSLYLTWSPYHYAAQAYGLAVMYSYRSGCKLGAGDKRLLFWVAMLPFLYNFTTAPGVGLSWLLPESLLALPAARQTIAAIGTLTYALALVTPPLLFLRVWRSSSGPMPLISILTVVTNGIWFLVLGPLEAFFYATVFHGIQYLAIVIIFHLKDQMGRPDNRHGQAYHVVAFYALCLALGYALFNCLPWAFVFAGFGKLESVLLVVAAINLHHFIVDAFIWRLKRGDANRRVVDAGLPQTA